MTGGGIAELAEVADELAATPAETAVAAAPAVEPSTAITVFTVGEFVSLIVGLGDEGFSFDIDGCVEFIEFDRTLGKAEGLSVGILLDNSLGL